MSGKWRTRLRIASLRPDLFPKVSMHHTSLRWEIIQAFDAIEQIAWRRRFGDWEKGRSVRSLDWDTYEEWQVWGPGVREYLNKRK